MLWLSNSSLCHHISSFFFFSCSKHFTSSTKKSPSIPPVVAKKLPREYLRHLLGHPAPTLQSTCSTTVVVEESLGITDTPSHVEYQNLLICFYGLKCMNVALSFLASNSLQKNGSWFKLKVIWQKIFL